MDFSAAAYALAWVAGALSTLSPCVVPILPILVSGALAQHRFGLWALAAGLAQRRGLARHAQDLRGARKSGSRDAG